MIDDFMLSDAHIEWNSSIVNRSYDYVPVHFWGRQILQVTSCHIREIESFKQDALCFVLYTSEQRTTWDFSV